MLLICSSVHWCGCVTLPSSDKLWAAAGPANKSAAASTSATRTGMKGSLGSRPCGVSRGVFGRFIRFLGISLNPAISAAVTKGAGRQLAASSQPSLVGGLRLMPFPAPGPGRRAELCIGQRRSKGPDMGSARREGGRLGRTVMAHDGRTQFGQRRSAPMSAADLGGNDRLAERLVQIVNQQPGTAV